MFGQVCVRVNVSAEIFHFPYGSRWLLAEGNHFKFVALQFFSQMISEMLWSECDLCLVPELNLRIKIKL